MANDRLFIQCRACGAEWQLGKNAGSVGWTFRDKADDGPTLADWLYLHESGEHMAEHDAWEIAAARPFTMYQEDCEPIPRRIIKSDG